MIVASGIDILSMSFFQFCLSLLLCQQSAQGREEMLKLCYEEKKTSERNGWMTLENTNQRITSEDKIVLTFFCL